MTAVTRIFTNGYGTREREMPVPAGSILDRDYSGAQDIYKKYSFDEEKYKHDFHYEVTL